MYQHAGLGGMAQTFLCNISGFRKCTVQRSCFLQSLRAVKSWRREVILTRMPSLVRVSFGPRKTHHKVGIDPNSVRNIVYP